MASGDILRPEEYVASDVSYIVEGNTEITVIVLYLIPVCEGPRVTLWLPCL